MPVSFLGERGTYFEYRTQGRPIFAGHLLLVHQTKGVWCLMCTQIVIKGALSEDHESISIGGLFTAVGYCDVHPPSAIEGEYFRRLLVFF